jgi:protein-disulfide isomerase
MTRRTGLSQPLVCALSRLLVCAFSRLLVCALFAAALAAAPGQQPARAQQIAQPAVPESRLQRFLDAITQDQVMASARQAERLTAAIMDDPALRALSDEYAALPQSRLEDGGFVLGRADAPFTLVEFADWACPHCQTYHAASEAFIREAVAAGNLRFEFRVLPTAGGGQTVLAASLAECAEEAAPGSFWRAYPFLYALGGNTTAYSGDLTAMLSAYLGLDAGQLDTCAAQSDQVTVDVALADTMGVNGTPAVLTRAADGALAFITWEGVTYDRGGVPIEVLEAVVAAAAPTAAGS